MSSYLIAYDISKTSRRTRVAKIIYGYALGGQKSALEVPVENIELKDIIQRLQDEIAQDTDKINIVKVAKHAILLGKATQIKYENGMVLL